MPSELRVQAGLYASLPAYFTVYAGVGEEARATAAKTPHDAVEGGHHEVGAIMV